MTIPTPAELVRKLDEHVAGQSDAKRALALALRQRWRLHHAQPADLHDRIQLPHVLLAGPEGTGKASLVASAAHVTGSPFARIETGQLWSVQSSDAASVALERFIDLQRVNGTLTGESPAKDEIETLLDRSIIMLHDLDLLISRDQNPSRGEIIQRELLPMLNGDPIPTRYGTIRPGSALIVGIGTFLTSQPTDLIPAFLAHLGLRVEFSELSEVDCLAILRRMPAGPAEALRLLLRTEDIEIRFTDDGLREIAAIAASLNHRQEDLGARRLDQLLGMIIEPVSFNVEEHRGATVEIDEAYVKQRLENVADEEDLERFIL